MREVELVEKMPVGEGEMKRLLKTRYLSVELLLPGFIPFFFFDK
jgi:hypothetical protein